MPWQMPTLAEVRAQARDDVAARLPGSTAAVPNSVLRVLADVMAGLAFLVMLFVQWLSKQFLPDTAEKEWLDRHAQIWLRVPRHASTFAEGFITVSGTPGVVLPASTPLSAGGIAFETFEPVTLGSGPTEVYVRALTPGVAGNLAAGAGMSLSTAIAGVDAQATVVSLFGGVDVEGDDSLRERVLARIQKPPMGGDADDYVAWAREVPGVTRAWCSPHEMGPGSVTIRFMMDELRADYGGFPLAGDVAVVQAWIDDRRPVTVQDCIVAAPVAEAVPVAVNNLVPDNTATRAAAVASMKAMIRDRAAPARAVNGTRVSAQTIHEEWMSAAILEAAGVSTFNLLTTDHPMPNNGNLAVLGAVTFGA